MNRPWMLPLAAALAPLAFASPALAGAPGGVVAEQVTVLNAADLLFGGTDADGGIDDWYLSNGIVEVIIDDAGLQEDLPPGVVTPPPKQNEAGFTGGTIIDLGRVGRNSDQLPQIFTVGGLSTSNFILYDSIAASTTEGSAKITATGRLLGFAAVAPEDLVVVTDYELGEGDDFLTVRTTVTNNGSEAASGLLGFLDAFIWIERLLPFSPIPQRGFDHPPLDIDNLAASLETPPFMATPGSNGPADGIVDPQTGIVAGEVSYGLLGVEVSADPDGAGAAPPVVAPVSTLFGISSHSLTGFGNSLAGGIGSGLPAGGVLSYERRLYVGDRNDVASSANGILLELADRGGFETGTLSGNVDAADQDEVLATVLATRTGGPATPGFPDGTPVTQVRTDEDGSFSGVVLPAGTYDLEIRSAERAPLTVTGVLVTGSQDTPVTIPALAARGHLEIELFERRKGSPNVPIPGKVVFKGRKGDPDPEFAKDVEAVDIGAGEVPYETFGGAIAAGNTAYLADGTIQLALRPGRYEIFASRGPEYSVQRKKVKVKAGKTKRLKFTIDRLVQTPDALSGDFHVHSARSLDSQAGLPARVASFAGENLEVMVSTEHDFVVDYGPVIEALDLTPFVSSIVGTEVTGAVPNPPDFPDSTGHINAWPFSVDANARRDGAIEDEFVAPNFIFSRLRARGAEVIQYNHVRAGVAGLTSIGFFNNFGYRPDLPITDSPNDLLLSDDVTGSSGVANPDGYRNLDFDVFEVGNGPSVAGWLETRADWISLLRQVGLPTPSGPVPFHPGSGVSDSHRVTLDAGGYFRSYVLGTGDDPSALDVTAFNTAIKEGRMVVTTGPYLEVSLADTGGSSAGVGETLVPASSSLTLHVRVQASPWVPVDEVRVLVNGESLPGLSFDRTTKPKLKKNPKKPWSRGKKSVERFEAEIPLDLGGSDAFVIVEAGVKLDPLPAPDPFGDLLVAGYRSIAFTNPIFVDLAGDGFDAPGVSGDVIEKARAPLATPRGRAALTERREHELRAHPSLYELEIPMEAALEAAEEAR